MCSAKAATLCTRPACSQISLAVTACLGGERSWQDELRAYREAMERREEEYQRIRMAEERRLSEAPHPYP